MPIVDLRELRTLIRKHARPESRPEPLIPSLLLGVRFGPTTPCSLVVEPVISFVAQGAKRVEIAGQIFDYREGQYLVVSVDLPADARVVEATRERPYVGCAITLRAEVVASLLLDAGGARPTVDDSPGIAVSDVSGDVLDPLVRLLRLLERPEDIPILAAALERELLWRLINGPQGALVRQIGLADSRMSQIGRSIRWLRKHYAETIRIETLAEIAGMSVTSLHRNFRMVTSLSPIQFQKHLRLQAARSRLMATRDDVSLVGFAVGYESPSQFSREYRRMFGKPPGQDAADWRRGSASTARSR